MPCRAATVLPLIGLLLVTGCGGTPRLSPLQVKGRWHKVEKGDTLDGVAKRYQASRDDIAELNDLAGDPDLASREEVFVPLAEGRPPGQSATASSQASKKEPRGNVLESKPAASEKSRPGPAKAEASDAVPAKRAVLLWPVEGKVTSGFGVRRGRVHEGIDIAAPSGTPIKAAAAGEVLYSGDELKGYGNLVILKHDDGLLTVYAHNKQNKVKEKQRVAAGEIIATVGKTGRATGPHLHFEVRDGDKPRNPMNYLPPSGVDSRAESK